MNTKPWQLGRGARAAWLAACVACVAPSFAAAAGAEARPAVRDMAYGETLFAFYQKQYFAAISRLLVARERGELRQQPVDGDWLLGGLYVQYGMPDAAGEMFARLLAEQARDSAVDGKATGDEKALAAQQAQALRIWLALAELNYRRERFPEALAIIETHIGREKAGEAAVVLAVKSLMRLRRYREAVGWVDGNFSTQPESRYLRFNLGVALVGDGETDAGVDLLKPLLTMPATDDEMLALRDRVALAVASARVLQGQPADAVAVLREGRVNGPWGNEALLIYGIAAQRSGELAASTRALGTLVKRPPRLQAVQEGWIALAQVYEAGNDNARALATYRMALKHLQGQLDYLRTQADNIDNGEWFPVLARRAGEIALRDTGTGLDEADVIGMPLHYRQFAGNRFVSSYTQYVEVSVLARVAADWQTRVPVLDYLAEDRQRRHERLRREAAALLASATVEPARAQQAALAAGTERLLAGADPRGYATEERQRLAAMASQVEARMARWPERDWSSAREKLALLEGVLQWEVAREQPAQAWGLRRAVRDNSREVDLLGERRGGVERALAVQQVSVEGWQPALQADARELARLAGEATALRQRLQARMEDDARVTVREQRERIVQLAAEAYFAIGQLNHGQWREKREERRVFEAKPVEPRSMTPEEAGF